jgi:hypothetical protein
MTEFVRWFLAVQIMAGAGWLATYVLGRTPIAASTSLRVSRLLMVAALVLPAVVAWVAIQTPWSPELQVWAFVERLGVAPVVWSLAPGARPTLLGSLPSVPDQPWPVLLYGSVLLACAWSVRSWTSLRGIVRRSRPHARADGLEVLISEEAEVPFAVWFPRRRIVVVDPATLEHPEDYRIAVLHERQHHSQGDPAFAYLSIFLRSLCIINPFAHAWARRTAELEEFACDEGVLASGEVSPKAYGQCLVRAAQRVAGHEQSAYAVGIMGRGEGSLLRRRLNRLAARTVLPSHLLPALTVSTSLMTVSAWVADGLLVGPGLADPEIGRLAERAPDMQVAYPEGEFLLHAIHELAGNPEGLRFVRRALYRGRSDLALVRAELAARGMPLELAAVPLIESGYANLRPRDATDGAGIWQLEPATARAYGLAVHDTADQRLDPEASTRAALDLLTDLHGEFGDWGLALAAYHQGARHVREQVAQQGSADPWVLVRHTAITEYPAMVLAAALMVEQPRLLQVR